MNNNLCKNILPKVKQFDPLIFYYRGYSEVSRKKKKKNPFREAFGRVKDLRSVLPGIPLLALTATVQSNERAKLIKAGTSLKSSDRRLRAGVLLAAAFSRERFAEGEMPVGELESLLEFDVT